MSARKRALQAGLVVNIARHDFGAESGEFSSFFGVDVAKSPLGSLRMARTSPPPCAPVAPTTAMIFFVGMGSHLLARQGGDNKPGNFPVLSRTRIRV